MHPRTFAHIPASSPSAERAEQLARLVYELLDAHADTSRLVDGPSTDLTWQTHLHYLQDLQRSGREILARDALEEVPEVQLP
jgi:hypothetical protein